MIEHRIEQLKREIVIAETNLIKNLKNATPNILAHKVQNIVSSNHSSLPTHSLLLLSSFLKIVTLISNKRKSSSNVLVTLARIIKAFLK
jgi:hypothetical protein